MMFNTILGVFKKRLVLLAFFCCILLASCDLPSSIQELNFQGSTMGTTYSIKTFTDTAYPVEKLRSLVDDRLMVIDQSMSTYIPQSEISRLNQNLSNEWLPVSVEICELLALSFQVSELSGGRFDITVGPLVNAWGFGPREVEIKPSDKDIRLLLERVGYRFVEFNCSKREVKKARPVYLDFSAIAKGYAVDQIGALLREHGFEQFMVEIGGEILLSGKKPESKALWKIAIERPEFGGGKPIEVLALTDVGVATSGDYRNFIEWDGERVSHTIDPLTGYPVQHSLASVTVISHSVAHADAMTTALNVLGPDAGFALAESEALAAFFIVRTSDGFEVRTTPSFQKYRVDP